VLDIGAAREDGALFAVCRGKADFGMEKFEAT
jgi:hypothetical protein